VQDGQNTSIEGKADSPRYIASEQKLPDQNSGLDEKPIQVGRKNLQLLSEAEISDRYVHLPVVRLLRDGTGRFEPDPIFIPPCISINASPALTSMLRRLIDILDEKSTVFTQEQQQRNGVFQAGMSARHVAQLVPACPQFECSRCATLCSASTRIRRAVPRCLAGALRTSASRCTGVLCPPRSLESRYPLWRPR
jgi:hypothetical protein